MSSEAACCAFCFIMVIVIIVLIIVLSEDIFGSGGSGGGGYYSSSGGGYRGSRGGGWGCFSFNTTVWTKNETQPDTKAVEIMIKNLREGDLVGTLEASFHQDGDFKFMWTRATDVTLSFGNWTGHTFEFSNGHHLTATSPHLMIIEKGGRSYFKRADSVHIGDEMIVNGIVTQVTQIKNHLIEQKVAIETEDGTVQVNGVFASGLCDDNPEVVNRIVKYESLLENYKSKHFGIEYNYMCMDNIAWKNAYLINNEFSK